MNLDADQLLKTMTFDPRSHSLDLTSSILFTVPYLWCLPSVMKLLCSQDATWHKLSSNITRDLFFLFNFNQRSQRSTLQRHTIL